MVFEYQDYRAYLRSVLEGRIARNPAYSLRAMAGNLGVSSSNLCEVLKGKRGFSAEAAVKVAHRLGCNETEREYFSLLVQLDATNSPELKETLLRRLGELNPRPVKAHDLTLDIFRVISDWYHFAILEMTYLDGGTAGSAGGGALKDLDPKTIADRLGISKLEAELALERLLRLELLEADGAGGYRKAKSELLVQARVPNEALRKFNRQMLDKASAALETQGADSRISATQTVPFGRDDLPAAERIIDECMARLVQLSKRSKKRTDVYHLGIHFFNLTAPGRN
jgi:uncharacterized protein (TIGR02147 family)